MVMHAGGNMTEDRMTLIEAINEAARLGSGFGHTRSQEAQREMMEQVLISATTSADALTAILRRAQSEAQQQKDPSDKPQQQLRRGFKRGKKPVQRLEWLDLMTPQNQRHQPLPEELNVENLTSIEKRLIARYLNRETLDPETLPTSSTVDKDKTSQEWTKDSRSKEAEQVVLEGGSYLVPFVPSETASSTTHSSAPSSPCAGPVPSQSQVQPAWTIPKHKSLPSGIKHAIKDADDAVHGTPLHTRPPQPLTHASLFATLKQFREQQQPTRTEEEDFAHF